MNTMNYKEYASRAYETASRQGFHDKDLSLRHWLMLVITEVAEMVEADRRVRHALVNMFKRKIATLQPEENKMKHWRLCFETFIKDSYEDEMADVCIRLFDLAGLMGWSLEHADMSEFWKNYQSACEGMSITEKSYMLCQLLTEENPNKTVIQLAIIFIDCMAKENGIDLEWHINQKLEYNEQRARLHGKKY